MTNFCSLTLSVFNQLGIDFIDWNSEKQTFEKFITSKFRFISYLLSICRICIRKQSVFHYDGFEQVLQRILP